MTVRIAMWSGPRNLSTALMRSWENRADTTVIDEPLYAHYLARTGFDHPARDEIIAAGPVEAEAAIARCLQPSPAGVSYQKHMSHHLLPSLDRAWIAELRNLLLLRDPVAVLASYTRVRTEVSLAEIGLPQQVELLDRAELVIDAGDFLTDPEAYLRLICDHLDLAFDPAMLSWPPGPRPSDGVWAPHWYDSVRASTGFGPPPSSGPAGAEPGGDPAILPPHLRPLATEALDLYRHLADHRIVL